MLFKTTDTCVAPYGIGFIANGPLLGVAMGRWCPKFARRIITIEPTLDHMKTRSAPGFPQRLSFVLNS